jgi:hypothetical protein
MKKVLNKGMSLQSPILIYWYLITKRLSKSYLTSICKNLSAEYIFFNKFVRLALKALVAQE